jgi:hypothetical protein
VKFEDFDRQLKSKSFFCRIVLENILQRDYPANPAPQKCFVILK